MKTEKRWLGALISIVVTIILAGCMQSVSSSEQKLSRIIFGSNNDDFRIAKITIFYVDESILTRAAVGEQQMRRMETHHTTLVANASNEEFEQLMVAINSSYGAENDALSVDCRFVMQF